MSQFRHFFPVGTGTNEDYTYARDVGSSEFRTPPRDRPLHGQALSSDLQQATAEAEQAAREADNKPKGVILQFEGDPGFKLKLKSLEAERSGIELRNSRTLGDTMFATVFVPQGKIGQFLKKIEEYADASKSSPSGKPKHRELVESIAKIRLGALESFWTDAGPFPDDVNRETWWEIWLRDARNSPDVGENLREEAARLGILCSSRELRFPDRRVLLARASIEQLLTIPNLFDVLAELRAASILASEFLELPPRVQQELVADLQKRITSPPADAASVCHLDSGINRGHPLIELALSEDHLLSADPSWSPADTTPQHGTTMAGLALYGCLTDRLNSNRPIRLEHRLESVKILPNVGNNDPDLYGDVTSQAMSRIEIAAPDRGRRVYALTVTADGRDEGLPSSWSAAIDQLTSGAEEDGRPSRLVIVSAGNTPAAGRSSYPDHNHIHGVDDPAQAWNAVCVGAISNKTTIREPEFAGWQALGAPDRLSPSSRTSIVWEDRQWPLKPDVVMEGGNLAIDPQTGTVDYVDDLLLLTTIVSPSGALLTSTGDTSAACALAARFGAMVWSRYPALSPESVRGLIIHSARWSDAMLQEFPHAERHNRLRAYGYGAPDLERALFSTENQATLIMEGNLQPFARVDGDSKTKDMALHRLPWPREVLESLGTLQVRMRITLSYFVEPSPGRRGWTRRHRYQSHGLRFDVRHPLESEDEFRKRVSKAAWDEDENGFDPVREDRAWVIGPNLRSRGSVHSDLWTGTAAQLASCGAIAVYPVTGWWRERPHLNRIERAASYSLIVSLETDSAAVDLYTPIANQIGVPIETMITTE